MPGKKCPNCGNATFFGKSCTKCGYTMSVPVNDGKGGKGKKCPNCDSYSVFPNGNKAYRCNSCGATFK